MRIFLKGASEDQVTTAVSSLRSKHIGTGGGAVFDGDGLVLVNDEDVAKALEILTQIGFSSRAG